jgi:hypothetical protein
MTVVAREIMKFFTARKHLGKMTTTEFGAETNTKH